MAKVPDYENHLAAAVLNDGRIISYRLLSRELKIHSNAAKRMLFEFHRKQNEKKPGSVHATYLLDGAPKPIAVVDQINGRPQHREDSPMQSSQFMSSAVQEEGKTEEFAAPSRSIILAREEDLDAAKSRLEILHSIHIYSLQPNTLQNLQALSDCNRSISIQFNTEDPLVAGQHYGVIHNNGVRRRTARRPLGVAPSIATAQKPAKPMPTPLPKIPQENETSSRASNPPTQEPSTKSEKAPPTRPLSKSSSKPPALKKEHSDIFKSFSKSKTSLKKEASPALHSQESAQQKDDEPMKDDSDDDHEEEDTYVPETNKADPQARSARSQRAEQLRKMMDDDDNNDNESDNDDESKDEEEDEKMPDADNEPLPADAPSQKEPTPEPTPTVSNGRRRGRRKVLKKKTIKDEEGYLVTKEEPAWESFSEEERTPMSSATGVGKGKKTSAGGGGGGKVGQGNIMSFFGKK